MKLQNNDIIIDISLNFTGLYETSFEIFIYKNNKQNIYIYYVSAVLIGNFIFF